MIAIELGSVVCDEPVLPSGQHARARTQQTHLQVGVYGCDRIVYLPGLALVVIAYMDATAVIVPLEHVWHMTVLGGVDALGQLAKVIA